MGAVIGISAYGRTQEKLGGAAGPTMQLPQGAGTTYVPPGQVNVSNQPNLVGGGFGGNAYGNTTTSNTGFPPGTATSWAIAPAPITTGYGGKKAPPQPDFPEI
jgi:hypothetical protein